MRHEYWFVVWSVCFVLCSDSEARDRVSLTGSLERWIGSQPHDAVRVPSSYRPVGVSTLRRTIESPAPKPHQRVIVRFEGITHHGIARFNRKEIGRMGPWTPYEFDVTSEVLSGTNQVEVEIADWQVSLGPGAGWEVYGGHHPGCVPRSTIRPLHPECPFAMPVELHHGSGTLRSGRFVVEHI